jgi:peptidoglycan/xylan/chitin deacetylase (PgdA/CDA1 family)
MTLLVLRYHRARAGTDGNSPEMLDRHFRYIASHFSNVLPGERLSFTDPSVCLCFDGAYYDFYATVFPLLRKYDLKAVLAIAPAVIRERTVASEVERIAVSSEAAYLNPSAGGFCTWSELEEMVDSELVAVAANGFTHRPIHEGGTDLATEIHVPRTLLGARLNTGIESFVFPAGRYSRRALTEAHTGYPYVFANGTGCNTHWHHRVLHRVCADAMPTPTAPFERHRLIAYRVRSLWSRLLPV